MSDTATPTPVIESAAARYLRENEDRLATARDAVHDMAVRRAEDMTKADLLHALNDNSRDKYRSSTSKAGLVHAYAMAAVFASPEHTALAEARAAVADEASTRAKMDEIVNHAHAVGRNIIAKMTEYADAGGFALAYLADRITYDPRVLMSAARFASAYLAAVDAGHEPREVAADSARNALITIMGAVSVRRTDDDRNREAEGAREFLRALRRVLPDDIVVLIGY